ncbi:MAG: ribonuclease R [bacterium]
MKKHNPQKDPHDQREAERYERPIPSREFLIDYLESSSGPMTHPDLCQALGLDDPELADALAKRLRAMARDGQIVRNRRDAYGPLDKMNLIKGRVSGHPEGFGFVIPQGGGEDLFLNSRQMRRVMDGDTVLVRIAARDRKGRPEGSIVEVVERGTSRLVGRYHCESGVHFVRPDNPRISQDIILPSDSIGGAKPGQVVLVELTTQPGKRQLPAGRTVQVLGDHLAPGMEIDIAIHNYGIPVEWPDAVQAEVKRLPDEVRSSEIQGRIDLRKKHFVTIDGEDARDFDDAVYCEPVKGGGWRLYVAIADVSHYVKVQSPLDKEAWKRGTSVYFPQQVIPMLPEKLSNGLCSLNPHVDRLCMVCEITLDEQGEVTGFWFFEGVIHSHARLTYTQVAAMLAQQGDRDSEVRQRFGKVVGDVDQLYRLYKALANRRVERGAIDFETRETRILFNADRKIEQIIPTQRTEAHMLIEECMLCANQCAAKLLEKSGLPALYRVHEGPTDEKLEDLHQFLRELGIPFAYGKEPTPLDYQRVIQAIAGRADAEVIQTVLLRSMRQAVYQPENLGHFGLNYEAYTHFTSPIRRYPDLLVHRAIRHLVRSKRRIAHLRRKSDVKPLEKKTIYPYDANWISEAGEQASMSERRADEATRDVENWLKCEFMLEHVGDEFDGVVASVTGFGLFVQLTEFFVEGLVHITGLPRDYYVHESAHHRLVGERSGRVFGLGERLRVRVARVNLEERKIDFDLVESAARPARSGREQAKSPARKTASAPRKRPAKAGGGESKNDAKSRKSGGKKHKASDTKGRAHKGNGKTAANRAGQKSGDSGFISANRVRCPAKP